MSKQDNIQIQYTLLCDEVRREDNGKLLIIGLYDSNMYVPSFPAKLSLTLLTRMKIAKPEDVAIEIEGLLNHERFTHINASINFHSGGLAFLPFPKFPATVKEKGKLLFRMRPAERKWITLWEGEIELLPSELAVNLSSTSLPPPLAQSLPGA